MTLLWLLFLPAVVSPVSAGLPATESIARPLTFASFEPSPDGSYPAAHVNHDGAGTGQKIVAQLADLVEGFTGLCESTQSDKQAKLTRAASSRAAKQIIQSLDALGAAVANQKTHVSVTNKPSKEFGAVLSALNDTIEHTLFPLVRSMDKRIAMDIGARQAAQVVARSGVPETGKRGGLNDVRCRRMRRAGTAARPAATNSWLMFSWR